MDALYVLFHNPKCVPIGTLLRQNQAGLYLLTAVISALVIVIESIIVLACLSCRVPALRRQGIGCATGFFWRLGPCLFTRRKESDVERAERELKEDMEQDLGNARFEPTLPRYMDRRPFDTKDIETGPTFPGAPGLSDGASSSSRASTARKSIESPDINQADDNQTVVSSTRFRSPTSMFEPPPLLLSERVPTQKHGQRRKKPVTEEKEEDDSQKPYDALLDEYSAETEVHRVDDGATTFTAAVKKGVDW